MSNPKTILISQIQQLSGVEGVELIMVEPCEDNYILCHVYFDPESVVDRLTHEEVQRRNYNANVRRGKITSKTTKLQFAYKAMEEIRELIKAIKLKDEENEKEERADVVHVMEAMAYHFAHDLQLSKELKMYVNETRTD